MTGVAAAPGADDRFAAGRSVADAVLYEGYVLYPYRASATKNRARWQWGVLVPGGDGGERGAARCDCLLEAGPAAEVTVRLRCLQLQRRIVEVPVAGGWARVDRLDVGGRSYVSWDEAVERSVEVRAPVGRPVEEPFAFAGGEEVEHLDGAGRVTIARRPVQGTLSVAARWPAGRLGPAVLGVGVRNTGPAAAAGTPRDEAMARSLLACHALLAVDGGRWISTLEPPEWAAPAAKECRTDGWYPVLVGDLVLASPIILYDQARVATESPGDMCDATEIDEILALRVLTLTDEEKAEARATDPRAAAIVDRCDGLAPEAWRRLHGEMRPVDPHPDPGGGPSAAGDTDVADGPGAAVPWWDPGVDGAADPTRDAALVAGREVRAGAAVVLRPSRRADIHDLFLGGLRATVAGVWRTVDGDVQVAVTIDDDPATEALAWQGRYLYFRPDELEPAP